MKVFSVSGEVSARHSSTTYLTASTQESHEFRTLPVSLAEMFQLGIFKTAGYKRYFKALKRASLDLYWMFGFKDHGAYQCRKWEEFVLKNVPPLPREVNSLYGGD